MARFEIDAKRRAGWRAGALAALAALAAAIALQSARLAERLDAVAFDLQVRLLRIRSAPEKARFEPDVVIVGFDEPVARSNGGPPGPALEALAMALEGIASAAPRATLIDVASSAGSDELRSPDFGSARVEGFVAPREAGGIVFVLEPDASGRYDPPPEFLIAAANRVDRAPSVSVAAYPRDVDGVVRRYEPSAAPAGHETFVSAVAGRIGHGERARQGGWVDYARGGLFGFVPLEYVARWHRTGDAERLRAVFTDRIVLVGAVRPRQSRWAQPMNLASWQDSEDSPPDVVLHAQVLRTLIGAGFLRPTAGWIAAGLALALALLALAPGMALNWALLALGTLAMFACATVQQGDGRLLPIGDALVAGLLAAGIRTSIEVALARRANRRRDRPDRSD